MENIKALEKAKMDLYHELVEYYTLLNLSKNKEDDKKMRHEVIRILGFIKFHQIAMMKFRSFWMKKHLNVWN